ncbi:MAG: sodium/proline symporter [Myxococcales bacterium]|nr:sodium/proline symporter [Myxococcales bacterium]
MTVVVVSFIVCLLFFLGVGIASASRRKNTSEDYLLASRSIGPWVVALSAVATNNSGFMFVGLIGATYTEGLSSLALMGGWVTGDYVAWLVGIPKALRKRSEEGGCATIPSFLGHGMEGGEKVVKVAALIVLVFLGTYAAAQLTAGSKALHALFGWDLVAGSVMGALIVVVYCFSGGIRASIWTDVVQSVVMFVAMLLLLLVGISDAGGPVALWTSLAEIDPQLVSIVPANAPFGFAMFVLGWLAAGFGVVGQPHIMVRAMAIDSAENMASARRVYVTWNVLFSISAVGVGLTARLLLPELSGFDPELAMPTLSMQLLHPVLVGLVLAGLFAATMSTADSQVLSCSAALTQDLLPRPGASHYYNKAGTVFVTAIVLGFALMGSSVFALVVLAWSSLAASLGPLLVIRCLGRRVTSTTALAMMIGGLLAVLGWKYGLGYGAGLYEALPGMLAGFAIYAIGDAIGGKTTESETA